MSDTTPAAEPIDGPRPVIAHHHEGGSNRLDKIAHWSPVRKVVSGKVAFSNYDFKQPTPQKLSKTSEHKQGIIHKIEVYHYKGLYGYKNEAHGAKLAERWMEQIAAEGKYFEAQGNSRHIQTGRWFRLSKDYESQFFDGPSADNEFFVLNVEHTASNNYLNDDGAAASYTNHFRCLRRKVPWRPAIGFNSQPCIMPGIDTATVVGPPGEEIYCDKYGRVKVQFHWDRVGQFNTESFCWIRVMTPWCNPNFGMVAVPRVGTEVVIQYLQGNPDLPLILGQVTNQQNMPPWDLPNNQTQTGILTRSSKGGSPDNANALRFEDMKGKEEF